jgi:endonuclease-3
VAESREARKHRAGRIVRALGRAYPDARIALRYRTPFELLVATILSAQCTDEKVNEVTADLFAKLDGPEALAAADPAVVEQLVHPTGFYRQKAKSIQSAARDVVDRFGGEVPGTLEELVTLRGVARKTANVVLGSAFGVPGLAIDTHMKRVNGRLGLTRSEDPVEIEADLMKLIPRRHWTRYTHQLIHHGRACCSARRPRCSGCPLRNLCPWPGSAAGRRTLRGMQ